MSENERRIKQTKADLLKSNDKYKIAAGDGIIWPIQFVEVFVKNLQNERINVIQDRLHTQRSEFPSLTTNRRALTN